MGNVALSYCFSNVYVVEYNTRDLFHSLLCPLLAEGWDSGGVGQEKWVSATRGSFYACSYQKTLLSIGLAVTENHTKYTHVYTVTVSQAWL